MDKIPTLKTKLKRVATFLFPWIKIKNLDRKVNHLVEKTSEQAEVIADINAKLALIMSQLNALFIHTNSTAEKLDVIQGKNFLMPQRYFAQFGEDKWILDNLKLPEHGVFVDVGTADGVQYSNSYIFEQKGWTGLCLEPDSRNFAMAQKYRKNVVQMAAASTKGELDFSMSAVSPDWSGLKITGPVSSTYKVKADRLSSILKSNKIDHIDLLSIDTEGSELEVWESMNFPEFQPKIVIIEYLAQNTITHDIKSYFAKLPYTLVHTTEANYIYTLNEN